MNCHPSPQAEDLLLLLPLPVLLHQPQSRVPHLRDSFIVAKVGEAPQLSKESASAPFNQKANTLRAHGFTQPQIEPTHSERKRRASALRINPGDQDIKISKKGFEPWTRKMKIKGGTISLNADLDPVR
jgi:hypothetical protein